MSPDLLLSPYFIVAATLGALGAVLILAGLMAALRRRPVRFAVRTVAGLLLASLGLLAGGLAVGIRGHDLRAPLRRGERPGGNDQAGVRAGSKRAAHDWPSEPAGLTGPRLPNAPARPV